MEALGTVYNGEQPRELVCPHSTMARTRWLLHGCKELCRGSRRCFLLQSGCRGSDPGVLCCPLCDHKKGINCSLWAGGGGATGALSPTLLVSTAAWDCTPPLCLTPSYLANQLQGPLGALRFTAMRILLYHPKPAHCPCLSFWSGCLCRGVLTLAGCPDSGWSLDISTTGNNKADREAV